MIATIKNEIDQVKNKVAFPTVLVGSFGKTSFFFKEVCFFGQFVQFFSISSHNSEQSISDNILASL
jgi:hypothetical protein